jgi:hypothetical protein
MKFTDLTHAEKEKWPKTGRIPIRFDELNQADQERWIELSRQTLEAKLGQHPGKSLLMVLPMGINEAWAWGRQDWAMTSPAVRLHVFPTHRLDAPVSLLSRMLLDPKKALPHIINATFHVVAPGPVKAEEAAYVMGLLNGVVGALPDPTKPGTHERFFGRWSESLRLSQPYPGGVPIPAHGEVLPYWPWATQPGRP